MGGGGTNSSSVTNTIPLAKRTHPAQWALYGPAAALGLQRAYSGTEERDAALADFRRQALANTAGSLTNLTQNLAMQGIDVRSPLTASLARGIETSGTSDLLRAATEADKAMRARQLQYFGSLADMLSRWPPAETKSVQQSSGDGK